MTAPTSRPHVDAPVAVGSCSVRGTATVEVTRDGSLKWVAFNDAIHVSADLVENEGTAEFLFEKYDIRERCPLQSDYLRGSWHAYLREPTR